MVRSRGVLGAVAVTVVGVLVMSPFALGVAGAAAPAAVSAFGANVQAGGKDVVPPTPAVAVAAPVGDETKTVVNIPASPVAVNGTLTATANDHNTADIASGLTVVKQAVPGPYNARGLAQIEGLGLLYDVAGKGVPILSAALVRAEAAVVCLPTPKYTANSEIIDLAVGGSAVPLNGPVEQLIDGITKVLKDTGLNAVVDVKRNVVTNLAGGGIGVDALVVTILSAAGAAPLAQVRLAHAEVTPGACRLPQCSDGVDNDGDAKIDTADPGCHTDGDATNAASYVPSDDDELDAAAAAVDTLPRTGGTSPLTLAGAGLAVLAGLGLTLRRRIAV